MILMNLRKNSECVAAFYLVRNAAFMWLVACNSYLIN